MESWLYTLVAPFVDKFLHRALNNPNTTMGGLAVGGMLTAGVAYLQSVGCPIDNVMLFSGLIPAMHGALSTDGNKAVVTSKDGVVSTVMVGHPDDAPTAGDLAHAAQGGGAA